MSRILIFSVEKISYVNRKGEDVEDLKIYYLDTTEQLNTRLERGFRVLSKSVYPDFDISDFSQLPGIYEAEYRPVRGIGGKMEPKFKSFSLVQKYEFNSASDYLVLGAKRLDFQTEEGKIIKGAKVFFLDTLGFTEDERYLGHPLLEAYLDKSNLSDFAKLPGYYSLDFEQVRGRRGDSIMKLKGLCLSSEVTGDVAVSG